MCNYVRDLVCTERRLSCDKLKEKPKQVNPKHRNPMMLLLVDDVLFL